MSNYSTKFNQQKSRNIKILHWNANGLNKKGKITEFKAFVNFHDFDILTLNETYFTEKRKPPKIKGYQYIAKFREQTINPRGGIVMYYKEHLNIIENKTDVKIKDLEVLCLTLNKNVNIFSIYNRNGSKLNVEEVLTLAESNDKVIIVGDFNARHAVWGNKTENQSGRSLLKLLLETELALFTTDTPTRYSADGKTSSTIDLIVTNNAYVINQRTYEDLESDHRPMSFELPSQKVVDNPFTLKIRNYKNVNWEEFRRHVSKELKLNRNITTIDEIDANIMTLTETIKTATDIYAPEKTIEKGKLPDNVIEEIKRRNKTRRQFQRYPTPQLQQQLKDQCEAVRNMIQEHEAEKWKSRINRLDASHTNVWKDVKKFKKGDMYFIPPIKVGNEIIANPKDKAEVLATKIALTHSTTIGLSDEHTENEVNQEIKNLTNLTEEEIPIAIISPTKIRRIIKNSRPYKAPGEDGIQMKTLKMLPRKAYIQIYYIYRACLKNNYFPKAWKKAVVIPIKKPGKDPSDPGNYRPISLLPVLGKIFEKLICEEIKKIIKEENILIEEQFGFRESHTTTHQLMRLLDHATNRGNMNETTTLLTLDLEKAFDLVWKEGLIYKMMKQKFPLKIIGLIKSYLEDRTLKVRIQGESSTEKDVIAGVPQGSPLSPTLFLLYINDIPKNPKTKLALFADDTAIMASSRKTTMANTHVNNHLQQITEYFYKWKLKLNPNKSEVINFNRKQTMEQHSIIKINNNPVKTVEKLKYLGVQLDRKLYHNEHVNSIKKKAIQASGIIYPYIGRFSILPEHMKYQLYKAYVRPIMLYASPAWINASDETLKTLQTVENKALRTILNKKTYEISNKELYKHFKITPILHQIYKDTNKFFKHQKFNSNLTKNLGEITPDSIPYQIKFKLLNQRLIENDPNI